MARRSASSNRPFTRRVSRDSVKGGRGRGRQSRPRDFVPLFSRLCRLELGIVAMLGKGPKDYDLDRFVADVLQREKDAITGKGRDSDQRGEVQLPQEGTPSWEGEGAPGVDWGPEGGEASLTDVPPASKTTRHAKKE